MSTAFWLFTANAPMPPMGFRCFVLSSHQRYGGKLAAGRASPGEEAIGGLAPWGERGSNPRSEVRLGSEITAELGKVGQANQIVAITVKSKFEAGVSRGRAERASERREILQVDTVAPV